MNNQLTTETDLYNSSTLLTHQSNLILRSKLNSNKGDFERLRKVANQQDGPIGADLERLMQQNDR